MYGDAASGGYNSTDDLHRRLGGAAAADGGVFSDTYLWSSVYRWIGRECRLPDPGMYAVIGMASFLGGSGRITMMLACVIVELTDDASLIGPVGLASIISMIVGNLFNHGLYHGLIPVQNLPFLNSEPADVMWIVQVIDVMVSARQDEHGKSGVVCVSKTMKAKEMQELVERCASGEITHHAFPVVDCAHDFTDAAGVTHDQNLRLRGIISLENLKIAASGGNNMSGKAMGLSRGFSMMNLIGKINLLDFADRSPITTVPHAKVARAFDVFRKLGMRHMCVTDSEGILVGILTRKDLMTFRLADNIRLHKAEALLRGWADRWKKKQVAVDSSQRKRVASMDRAHTFNSFDSLNDGQKGVIPSMILPLGP